MDRRLSAVPAPQEDQGGLGRWTEPSLFVVQRSHLQAYAQAVGDTVPAHVRGDVAGPVFPLVPVWDILFPLLVGFGTRTEGVEGAGGFHAEHDFCYHQAVTSGMVLRSRAALVGARPTAAGLTVIGEAVSETVDGEPVVSQRMSIIRPGLSLPGAIGESMWEPAVRSVPEASLVASGESRVGHAQPLTYAEVSGDRAGVHIDRAEARRRGFPNLLNHGACTLALAARLVLHAACEDDVTRLERLRVRFSAPVLAGDTLVTRVRRQGPRELVWDSLLADGRPCLRNGFVVARN